MSFIILTFVLSIYRRADTHKGIWSVDSNLPYTFLIPFQTPLTYKGTNYISQLQIYCDNNIIQHLLRFQHQNIIIIQHQNIILLHVQIIPNKFCLSCKVLNICMNEQTELTIEDLGNLKTIIETVFYPQFF